MQSKQSSSYSDRDTTEDDSESLDDMDFLSRQKKLQAEAQMALAMAKPMAKMQVEVEKQNRKKSPVADLVSSRTATLPSNEKQANARLKVFDTHKLRDWSILKRIRVKGEKAYLPFFYLFYC